MADSSKKKQDKPEWPETMTPSVAAEYVLHLLGESVTPHTIRFWCDKYGIGSKSPPVPWGRYRVYKKKLYGLLSPAVEALEKNRSQSMDDVIKEIENKFDENRQT